MDFEEEYLVRDKKVPFSKQKTKQLPWTYLLSLITVFFAPKLINCEQFAHHRYQYQLATSRFDYTRNAELYPGTIVQQQYWEEDDDLQQPFISATPPLDRETVVRSRKRRHHHVKTVDNEQSSKVSSDGSDEDDNGISPAKVYSEHFVYGPKNILFSPIFNLHSADLTNDPIATQDKPSPSISLASVDVDNGIDFMESGSGAGWDNLTPEGTSNLLEDSRSLGEYDQMPALMPTPVMTPIYGNPTTPYMMGDFNKAPTLNRRLPKLSTTAGQVWNYFVPFDTFTDEDGDLRQLKSMIYIRNSSQSTGDQTSNLQPINDYYSWLHYDSDSQLIYGLPTERDVGGHMLVLEAMDRWGATTTESFEINVQRHQSIRAFTHLFVINRIEWNQKQYPSMVDAIGELVKRISTFVYFDEPFKNSIVQYYQVNNLDITNNSIDHVKNSIPSQMERNNNASMSFNIGWSNSSLPVHPCILGKIETLARLLIDTQTLKADWSLEKGDRIELMPSQVLIKAMAPEFRPGSISVNLQGSCEGKDSIQDNSVQINEDSTVKPIHLRVRIGKLSWTLGEPIEYEIPEETFEVRATSNDSARTTKDLHLTLHTIDGLTFNEDPKYSFLEFNQESQTLFGMSFDRESHSGQREILLTARHPSTGYKVREVFIIDIEPQDLTSLNNRAFRMSLYLVPRTGLFGPRERVSLSRKIAGALKEGDANLHHIHKNPNLIVTKIQEFAIGSYSKNPANLNYMLTVNNYHDKIIRVIDSKFTQSNETKVLGHGSGQDIVFYKFTWTNGTIGYRGDCPVEVIKENILFALERSMIDLRMPDAVQNDDNSKNDSARFYERLRFYFEPESDLIHIRFEPLGACISALEIHDVGYSEFADLTDRSKETTIELLQEVMPPTTNSPLPPIQEVEVNNDEVWSIVVLIVLVLVLIFVIIMFYLGISAYRANQDKKLELQIRLAQARQNSMYLSSMILANQAAPPDIYGGFVHQTGVAKSLHVVQDEENGARKPVILDNEKKLLERSLQPTTVQLNGQKVNTLPMNPNMTFTLDSIGSSVQTTMSQSPSRIIYNQFDDKQRSVTLNRRTSNSSIHKLSGYPTSINHSQSILTVASLSGPVPIITPGRYPLIYGRMPAVSECAQSYHPLQRGFSQHKLEGTQMSNANLSMPTYVACNGLPTGQTRQEKLYSPNLSNESANVSVSFNKDRSPSYSTSTSATTHSVVSNPNYRV